VGVAEGVGVGVGVSEGVGVGVALAFGTTAAGLLHTSFLPDLIHV
jgi:hypothetical protein